MNAPQTIPTKQGLGPIAGAVCGLFAALGYAGANAALRKATDTDAVFVSAMKALPTLVACAPLLISMSRRGQAIATSWSTMPILILGVTVGQLLGNLLFQVALGIIGLALAVPLCLSAMIIGGALLGNWILGEPVSKRTWLAITVLIAATCVLSLGGQAIVLETHVSAGELAIGLITVFVSGVAYAFFSVTMRKALRGGVSVPLSMMTSGVVGVALLFPLAYFRIGSDAIMAIEGAQWQWMIIAGCLNTAAFFMLSFSLRAIPVVAVNLLNATQATLAAIMGVCIFLEPLTTHLIAGSALTVLGLVILGTSRLRLPKPAADARQNV